MSTTRLTARQTLLLLSGSGLPVLFGWGIITASESLPVGLFNTGFSWFGGISSERVESVVDGRAFLFFLLSALLISFMLLFLLQSKRIIRARTGVLIAGLTGSLYGLFLAGDYLLLIVFWQLLAVMLYYFMLDQGFSGRQAGLQFAFRTAGSIIFLGVLALMVGSGDSLTVSFSSVLPASVTNGGNGWLLTALVIAFIAGGGLFPLHFRSNSGTAEPTIETQFFVTVLVPVSALYIISRIIPFGASQGFPLQYGLFIVVMLGIVYGALLALGSSSSEQFINYLSISSYSIALAALLAGIISACPPALFQTFSTALIVSGLILSTRSTLSLKTSENRKLSPGKQSGWQLRGNYFAAVFLLASAGFVGSSGFIGILTVALTILEFSSAAGLLLVALVFSGGLFGYKFFTDFLMLKPVVLSPAVLLKLAIILIIIIYLGLNPNPLFEAFSCPETATRQISQMSFSRETVNISELFFRGGG